MSDPMNEDPRADEIRELFEDHRAALASVALDADIEALREAWDSAQPYRDRLDELFPQVTDRFDG